MGHRFIFVRARKAPVRHAASNPRLACPFSLSEIGTPETAMQRRNRDLVDPRHLAFGLNSCGTTLALTGAPRFCPASRSRWPRCSSARRRIPRKDSRLRGTWTPASPSHGTRALRGLASHVGLGAYGTSLGRGRSAALREYTDLSKMLEPADKAAAERPRPLSSERSERVPRGPTPRGGKAAEADEHSEAPRA